MATPNFSALLPEVAVNQLAELTKLYGIGKTQVVIRAISELYRKEFPMNIELNYKPHTEYKGHTIETATGIGGHFARTRIEIDADTVELLEVGPSDSERGALQSMRNTINDTLFAHGLVAEPRNGYNE